MQDQKIDDLSKDVIAAKECDRTLGYLLGRRSVPIKLIGEPGPSEDQIDTILQAAMRVPDHGRLFPWHFMVFEGDARKDIGDIIASIYEQENPGTPEAKIDLERQRFTRAPLVIGVTSRIREGKHPAWEQILSAGAACQNLCLAANASGFGANWITEWYSYSEPFKNAIGLDERDQVAGFIHIGTPSEPPAERDRPDAPKIVTKWTKGITLNKGDDYDKTGMGLPESRIHYSEPSND